MSTQNTQTLSQEKKVPLSDIVVDGENIALSVMIGILDIVHRRGGLTMEESSKVWECIRFFKSKEPETLNSEHTTEVK